MSCTLGIDIGTTGSRALLVSEDGEVISSTTSDYPLSTPRPGWTEQSPHDWWDATVLSIKKCLEKARQHGPDIRIAAIGLSGQMHGSVFLDSKGLIIRPAILWNDQRTGEQCRQITDTVGLQNLIDLTCNRALTGFTAPKILWLKENEPENYAHIYKVLLPKDYIRYKLTGTYATEVSDASGTLLFDVKGRRWSSQVLSALGIPLKWMPDCHESTVVSGHINREAAAVTGLTQGTPVVGGGGDQAAGAVGNGIVRPGLASCVIGTSGVIFWHSELPSYDRKGRLHCFCHAVPGKWHLMGVTLSAGGSLKWFRDTLCQDIKAEAKKNNIDAYKIIDEQADSIPAGSEGLIFLPYLSGERTPYADDRARGAFIGLTLRHTRAHMARAVMEGVAFSLKDCLELGKECGVNADRMLISGGGGRSALWRQMISDTFGLNIRRINADEGPAYGAAILAAVGAGQFRSVEEACDKFIKITETHKPDKLKLETYGALYKIFSPLYSSLRDYYQNAHGFMLNHTQTK